MFRPRGLEELVNKFMDTQLWLPFSEFPAKNKHVRYMEVDNTSSFGLDPDRAANLAIRICMLLQHGRYWNAMTLIINTELDMLGESNLNKIYEPLLESRLASSDLSLRIINMLEKVGFLSWGDVVRHRGEWLEENIPNWGRASSDSLKRALRFEIEKRRNNVRE